MAQTTQKSVGGQAAPPPPPAPPADQEQVPLALDPNAPKAPPGEGAAGISGAPPPPGQRVVSREERVEYRDQDGNILDEEQVKALEGKVEFRTRYETRTRVVDANGNEIPSPDGGSQEDPAEQAGVAPPHPDVEGAEKSTRQSPVPDEPIPPPADKSIEGDREKEQSRAKPASEGSEATSQQA